MHKQISRCHKLLNYKVSTKITKYITDLDKYISILRVMIDIGKREKPDLYPDMEYPHHRLGRFWVGPSGSICK